MIPKRICALLLCTVLSVAALTGCAKPAKDGDDTNAPSNGISEEDFV